MRCGSRAGTSASTRSAGSSSTTSSRTRAATRRPTGCSTPRAGASRPTAPSRTAEAVGDAGRAQPIRIVRVIARMNVGGPALHIAALISHMPPERYDAVLVTGEVGPGEVEAPVLEQFAGPRLVRLPFLGPALNPWRDLRTLFALV